MEPPVTVSSGLEPIWGRQWEPTVCICSCTFTENELLEPSMALQLPPPAQATTWTGLFSRGSAEQPENPRATPGVRVSVCHPGCLDLSKVM